jgi:hypothetical protein
VRGHAVFTRADAGDSGSDRLAYRSDRAGRVRRDPSVTHAANTAPVASSARATVLPRRAVRFGGAGLVDAARVVARGAGAAVVHALPLVREGVGTHVDATAVDLTVVVARHVARHTARRKLRDVRVGGRAGRNGAVAGDTGASTVVSAGTPVSAAAGVWRAPVGVWRAPVGGCALGDTPARDCPREREPARQAPPFAHGLHISRGLGAKTAPTERTLPLPSRE